MLVDVNSLNSFKGMIFPNPAQDLIHFQLNETGTTALLEVLNQVGQVVIKQEITQNENISVNGLAPGVYFYIIHIKDKNLIGRFVKI